MVRDSQVTLRRVVVPETGRQVIGWTLRGYGILVFRIRCLGGAIGQIEGVEGMLPGAYIPWAWEPVFLLGDNNNDGRRRQRRRAYHAFVYRRWPGQTGPCPMVVCAAKTNGAGGGRKGS